MHDSAVLGWYTWRAHCRHARRRQQHRGNAVSANDSNFGRLMPQPALHLLLARQTLERWRGLASPPFDLDDADAVNAFLHGSLAPDMGNFPGGSTALAHLVHTQRTGEVQRALFNMASTGPERAFAHGWLTHVIADALIHPLINADAARRTRDGQATIVEHVRVEVGIDVAFCWQHAALDGLRLLPAFDRISYQFLADTLNSVVAADVSPARLAQMERGLVMFSHGALHFATSVARQLCWQEGGDRVPLGSTFLWHTALRLSPRDSLVNAYLRPHVPDPQLLTRTENAVRTFEAMLDEFVADKAESLPDYNLEDGTIVMHRDRHVA
jgi:hypothetical protein